MAKASTFTPTLALRTMVAWAATLLIFFPLGWLVLTAFKTELQAISVPPLILFTPTFENFHEVQSRSDYLHYAMNSLVAQAEGHALESSLWRARSRDQQHEANAPRSTFPVSSVTRLTLFGVLKGKNAGDSNRTEAACF